MEDLIISYLLHDVLPIGFFLLLILPFPVMSDQEDCSPLNDMVRRKRTGQCKMCKKCPPGKGRNFENARATNDTLDLTKCLPCEECPNGTFNNNQIMNGNECASCTRNKCKDLRRDIQEVCSSIRDEQCGSCTPGYWDCMGGLQYRCCALTKSPEVKPTPTAKTSAYTYVSDSPAKSQDQWKKDFDGKHWILLPITGSILLAGIVVAVVLMKRSRRHKRCSGDVISPTCMQSNTSVSSDGSEKSSLLKETGHINDNISDDLESDGPPKHPRRELSNPLPQPSTTAEDRSDPFNDFLVKLGRQLYKTDCSCDPGHCTDTCKPSVYDTVRVTVNDYNLEIIATNICHDPYTFIQNLEMPDSEKYNIEDDRIKAPLTISQHEFIYRILKRWVELKADKATYGRLRRALCAGGFHRVNTKCFAEN